MAHTSLALPHGWLILLKDGEPDALVHCFSSLLGPHPHLPMSCTRPAIWWVEVIPQPIFGGVFVLMLNLQCLIPPQNTHHRVSWLISFSPVWLQAESAGIDLIAGAVALQSISWLVASHRLSKFKAVCGWGFWMGCAFMTKYTAPLFLVGPCLIAAYWAIRYGRWNRRTGLLLLCNSPTMVVDTHSDRSSAMSRWLATHSRDCSPTRTSLRPFGMTTPTCRGIRRQQPMQWAG